MSVSLFLKNRLNNIPPSIGKVMNTVPFDIRPGIGHIYRQRKKEIRSVEYFSLEEKRDFVFTRITSLVDFAYNNVSFYHTYYNSKGFHPADLKTFSDIDLIPIIDKALLNSVSIEERSAAAKWRYKVNTGGSTGKPFSLFITPDSMGHEWAHMHDIWRRIGYKHNHFKLVFGGRSNVNNCIQYDVVRNSFLLDIYADFEEVSKRLKPLLKRFPIKYLHGYPSSIYDFALYCQTQDEELKHLMRKCLVGAFLGSEYPHQHYREAIERIWNIRTISWYGHTERALLAGERTEKFVFYPFLTYGFSEAVQNEHNEYSLIGTSFYNYASPLIRYNTEDIIEAPLISGGILEQFKILKGRTGEFVTDKSGKKINLTGLIFGRHHQLFEYAKFIQVRQVERGHLEIIYVGDLEQEKAKKMFDLRNMNFHVTFSQRSEPIRSSSGKLSLLVS